MEMDIQYSSDKFRELLSYIESIEDLSNTPKNIDKAVENIRHLSEFLIYGKNKDNTYFEIFVERNILEIFSEVLDRGIVPLNVQLIQTTSILIQNIDSEQDTFYLLSHPFLNTLISYDFDLSGHNEIVDYFVSFLKMLALKINKENIQFFYNTRFRNFPIFGTAVKLFNHPELMVKTAARTISLQIFTICNQELLEAVLSLPHAIYFPHLACELRDLWIRVDQNMISDLDINDLKDDIEDINDLLSYIQDIFDVSKPAITIALANSLIYYAYFPSLIGSLGCMTKNPDINSYSACIYFLNQTYHFIKEPLFLNALSCGLFLENIPRQYAKYVEYVIKPPQTYSAKYQYKGSYTSLTKYILENISIVNIEGFYKDLSTEIRDESQTKLIQDLINDYEMLKLSKEEEETDDTRDGSDLNQREAIELIINRLKTSDYENIKDEHLHLSVALGKPIGVWEKSSDFEYLSPTHYSEGILDSIYSGKYKIYMTEHDFITNKYCKTLLNFLRSKDDSLLLLIGSLMYSYTLSDTVDPALLYESHLYPIGNRKKSQLLNSLLETKEEYKQSKPSKLIFEEEKTLMSGSQRDRVEYEKSILEDSKSKTYDDSIMNMLLELLKVDPPFRPVTFKFIAVITCNLCYNKNLSECLSLQQYEILVEAFILSINNLKQLYSKQIVKLFFMDMFEKEWKNFVFIDYETLNKVVKSPWSLVPVFEEKHRKKLPEFLKPAINLYQETKNAIQQFLSLRHMIHHLMWRSGIDKLKQYPFKFEERDVYNWEIGQNYTVQKDKTLVLCSIELDDQNLEFKYIVLDPEYFILIEPNFKNEAQKTINIQIKAPLEKVDLKTDAYDQKRLTIVIREIDEVGEEIQNSFLLHFENNTNCRSVRKTIEDNRKIKKYFIDTLIMSFLDGCVKEVKDEDGI